MRTLNEVLDFTPLPVRSGRLWYRTKVEDLSQRIQAHLLTAERRAVERLDPSDDLFCASELRRLMVDLLTVERLLAHQHKTAPIDPIPRNCPGLPRVSMQALRQAVEL